MPQRAIVAAIRANSSTPSTGFTELVRNVQADRLPDQVLVRRPGQHDDRCVAVRSSASVTSARYFNTSRRRDAEWTVTSSSTTRTRITVVLAQGGTAAFANPVGFRRRTRRTRIDHIVGGTDEI